MKNNEVIRIAIAESSIIIRNGVITTLKRIPELNVHPLEITSMDALHECMRVHTPDILIVNPSFGGWFDITAFKEEYQNMHIKCICLLCTVFDSNLLKSYDENFCVYDNVTTIGDKINRLQHISVEEGIDGEQEALSQREKEIIICVVKGMTNKAIADKLYLSIHTVITHRRNIARKLQIHSPAGLTIYAIVNKLVELQDIEG